MQTFIALLRGINVGGKNILPMQALKTLLENLGLRYVKTYIQSGNVVFQSEEADAAQLADRVSKAIANSHGFAPRVVVLRVEEVEHVMASNPFKEAEIEPKSLHIGFLDSVPMEPDLEKLEGIRKDNERFELHGRYFYLHAPDGVGGSKLAANAEKLLGVPMTDRNWRTVAKIMAMAAN